MKEDELRNIDLENEKNFENRKAGGEPVRAKQLKFYWATFISTERHKKETLNIIKNSNVLEIGCASGHDAIDYCKCTKSYTGVDISDVAIQNCNELSIKNAFFYCVDGHKLPVDDKSIDFVIVNSLLHHLDLEVSFKEISRILTDSGALIFREPLGTNPAFQIYRMLTPGARTIDERPFTFSDLRLMKKYFDLDGQVQWFGFFSVISAFLKIENIRAFLTKFDRVLSKTPLKYFFGNFRALQRKRLYGADNEADMTVWIDRSAWQ